RFTFFQRFPHLLRKQIDFRLRVRVFSKPEKIIKLCSCKDSFHHLERLKNTVDNLLMSALVCHKLSAVCCIHCGQLPFAHYINLVNSAQLLFSLHPRLILAPMDGTSWSGANSFYHLCNGDCTRTSSIPREQPVSHQFPVNEAGIFKFKCNNLFTINTALTVSNNLC